MSGVYSIAEVIDDSNKRPKKTVFCYLKKDDDKEFEKGAAKSLDKVGQMVEDNGGKCFKDLKNVVDFLNGGGK
jgi:hypothetical protein